MPQVKFPCRCALSLLTVYSFAAVAFANPVNTIHDTDNDDGTVLCVSANQPPNNNPAEWECSGSVEYSSAQGGGGDTQFTFSNTEDCEFATFTPMENYEDAVVDGDAVIYAYNASTLVQTELDASGFGHGEILNNPWSDTIGIHGPGTLNVNATSRCRYKVRAGYWPAAPNPFVVLGGVWTGDL